MRIKITCPICGHTAATTTAHTLRLVHLACGHVLSGRDLRDAVNVEGVDYFDDGHPEPTSRARVARWCSDNGESTPTASPAGLASESFSWILRGLYQEQWEAVLAQRQYGREQLGAVARWVKTTPW